jgi:serine/threonine protein kinase
LDNPATKRLGRYEVLGELGRGAMGVVYKARDPQIDRIVAVKTVCLRGEEPEAEVEFRHRFLNEAKAAGRLHHPGIVSVFDVGEDAETHNPYIVLEYVAGEALNKILAREKKLALTQALGLAEEIAEALGYAHEQGVTHRDIKPGNILITQDGHAKIADFGIAKLNLAHFTIPGRVLGTPAYMAPEQLTGEGCDGRSDLFSLGVILYAMVTGHSPFQGNSATTVCFKVANREPIAASVLDLNLPHELDAVIGRAMAKNPDERYQNGTDFAADLRLLHSGIVPPPSPTTTSLQVITAAVDRQGKSRTGTTSHATAFRGITAPGAKPRKSWNVFAKWPTRDLVLGGLTIALLALAGLKSGLLHPLVEGDPVQTVQKATPPSVPAAQSATVTENAAGIPAESAAIAKPTLHKAASVRAESSATRSHASSSAGPVLVAPSMVELSVRHQFKDATLTVWVDDQLLLTRPLHAGTQKKLVVFSEVHGMDSETLKVPAGKHMLRLRVQTGDQTIDLSKTVAADFIGGEDKTLLVTFDKRNTAMHLEWE